jgi:hypothetical protein
MTDNGIDDAGLIRLPDQCITITPIRDGLTTGYQRAPDGTDLLVVIIDDKRVGTVRSLLTVDGALSVASAMVEMAENLDKLRDEWRINGLDA